MRIQLNLHDLAIMYCEGEIEIMEDEDSEVSYDEYASSAESAVDEDYEGC